MSAATGWRSPEGTAVLLARNITTRYALIGINVLIGLVVLPFNISHLGSATYGLWMLATSITVYFTVLDLGYGSAVIRFVAEYRAKRDATALNEVLSTMFYVFAALGAACYLLAIATAALFPYVFSLAPGQAQVGRAVLLIIAIQVALYFPFSVYGGVINGFERFYVNNVVATGFNIATAVVNVLVLWWGYGLVVLVAATTVMRIIPFWIYRRNAYAIFPELRISPSLIRRERLRELTGFSVSLAAIDWSGRLMYATGPFFLGMFVGTAAVGLYAIAQRVAEALLRMTNQLHTALFPAVVQRAVHGQAAEQRALLVTANRLQLACAVCLCGGVAVVSHGLIRTWIGPEFVASAVATQLLAMLVVLRAWMAMPSTVLKGMNHHGYVARASMVAAVANLLLSLPLVKRWGIVGVASAAVVPAFVLCTGFIFPKACQLVGLRAWDAYRQIVWPAAWPGLVVMALLMLTTPYVPQRLISVLAHFTVGAATYVLLFVTFALEREERDRLRSTATAAWRHRSQRLATV